MQKAAKDGSKSRFPLQLLTIDVAEKMLDSEQFNLFAPECDEEERPSSDDFDEGGYAWSSDDDSYSESSGDDDYSDEDDSDGDSSSSADDDVAADAEPRSAKRARQEEEPIDWGELKRIKRAHPSIDGVAACYHFFKSGSCAYGGQCHFHHGE
jgi:hypothetical protein